MESGAFYRGGGFEVTDRLLRTPRKSYALGQIEYVSVQRPLLLFLGLPALGLMGFCVVFWRYLYPGEVWTMIAAAIAAIIVALLFGTLRVHSLALRDDEVALSFGPIARLRSVRGAVEQAMASRAARRDDA